jgi:hypothetical protein
MGTVLISQRSIRADLGNEDRPHFHSAPSDTPSFYCELRSEDGGTMFLARM